MEGMEAGIRMRMCVRYACCTKTVGRTGCMRARRTRCKTAWACQGGCAMQSPQCMHATCFPADRFSPGSVCMAHMQEPRASLGKERAPQGQDLPRGKRCQVEVLHELIGACEHGQVCTVHAILLQDARESTHVPAFEE